MSIQSRPKLSITELLEREIQTFINDNCELLSHQIDSFASYCEILREDEETSAKRQAKQRHSESQRVRNLLVDIYTSVGQEVFVLCAVAVPNKTLQSCISVELIPALQRWWAGVTRSPGLTRIAAEVCQTSSIDNLVSEIRRRKLEKITAHGSSMHHISCLRLPANCTKTKVDHLLCQRMPL
jgi:hypothetical protein